MNSAMHPATTARELKLTCPTGAAFAHTLEERGRGGEHRENYEVHGASAILELLADRRQEHSERTQHETGEDQGRQNGDIANRRRLDLPEPGDGEKRVDLRQRYPSRRQ
jgi:hypothetical protein